jgi:hypothetical protein
MSVQTIVGAVIAIAVVAFLGFVGVAVTEFSYAAAHPFRYGPAKVIAWSGVSGAALSAAVALLAIAVLRSVRR